MRIGYNTWSMAKVPYQAFIPGLSDIGFRAIAISVVPGYTIGGQWVDNAAALDQLSADDRRRIKQAFVERDLMLPSVIGNQSLVEEDAAKSAVAMQTSVPRLLPLANAVEIKDQQFRYTDDGPPSQGWLVEGNGVGRATAPDGRPVEYQFLLAGEGTFDLAGYLKLVKANGFNE